MKEHRIAVIPGDGIGREVIPEGVRVLEAVGAKHGIRLNWTQFDWSCDYYMKHGKMRPDDAPDVLRKFDATITSKRSGLSTIWMVRPSM